MGLGRVRVFASVHSADWISPEIVRYVETGLREIKFIKLGGKKSRIMPQYVTPSFEVLGYTTDALKLIERSGRTCYKSEDKMTDESHRGFVRKVLARKHDSVIEHASATVKFVVDRGVSHEMVRHRLCSFSQESTRYCDYGGKGITLIHPPGLTGEQRDRRERHFWLVQTLYDLERSEGVRPEIARGVLPTCLKTELVWTANVREWRHILSLRAAGTTGTPHPQMVEVMVPLLAEFKRIFPGLFDDIGG